MNVYYSTPNNLKINRRTSSKPTDIFGVSFPSTKANSRSKPARKKTAAPLQINQEPILRFLCFCVFVCLSLLFVQIFSSSAEASKTAKSAEVKVYSQFNLETPQVANKTTELTPIPASNPTTNSAISEAQPEVTTSQPTTSVSQSTSASKTYEVKSGDSLYLISQKVGVSPEELARINNLENPRSIKVGQQLKLN